VLVAPFHLAYRPTADEVAQAAGDPSRLRLAIWAGSGWAPLTCSVDPAAPLLMCDDTQAGEFAVLVASANEGPSETALPNGRFYAEANGFSGVGSTGFSVIDDDGAAMWTAFQSLGGVDQLGYPVSERFMYGGFITQAFQKAALQWRPDVGPGQAVPVNVFDDLNLHGSDAWLQSDYQIPPEPAGGDNPSMSWDDLVAEHLALLDAYPALGAYYDNDPDGLNHFGLPESVQNDGNLVVARMQRGMLEMWLVDEPWGPAGTVIAGNAGDLAKDAGLWPLSALAPQPAPTTGGDNTGLNPGSTGD
jgi:hypothetical protein